MLEWTRLRENLGGSRGTSLHTELLKNVFYILLHGARARPEDGRKCQGLSSRGSAMPGLHPH